MVLLAIDHPTSPRYGEICAASIITPSVGQDALRQHAPRDSTFRW
jgi:hypothetical protein